MKLPDDLLECVRLVQAGVDQDENFRLVFVAVAPRLRRFFSRRGCTPHESEDLTQDTFIRVYRGLKTFRGDVDFPIWLYQIARNVLANARRDAAAQKRRGDHAAVALALFGSAPEGTAKEEANAKTTDLDPLGIVLTEQKMAAVRDAISALPPQMRRCLVLRIYQERSYEEIAAILQLSLDTVKSHLFQARRRLRATLEADDRASGQHRATDLREQA